MKTLTTLIRLSKRALDALRKKQVALENQKMQLQEAIKRLAAELATEQKLAEKSPEMGSFYGGFSKRIQMRQNEIRQEISRIDAQLVALSEEIMIAFSDLKKYEIALDNKKAKIKAEETRKETIAMDEVAVTRFIRQQEDEKT